MWWILASLAARLGTDLLAGADPDQLDDEAFLAGALAASPHDAVTVFANGPHNCDGDDPVGWVREEVLPDGRWHLVHPELLDRLAGHEPAGGGALGATGDLVLVPRREMAWSNSVRYGAAVDDDTAPETARDTARDAVVRLHPDDATRHGVVAGRRVRVTSAHGELVATLRVDDGLRAGTVSITHGRPGANAGALVSPWEDVDPLSTMPRMSGVAVTLAPGPASEDAP